MDDTTLNEELLEELDDNLLNKLLSSIGKYHPHYGNNLANHLPMELLALRQLGASDNKLQSTFDKSIAKLNLLADVDVNKNSNISDLSVHLGNKHQYLNYLHYFQNEIESFGFKIVLKKTLSILLPGIAASAFHALIRLAYAIEAKNNNEIAIALAYWSAEFQSFEISSDTTEVSDMSLENIIKRLAPLGEKHQFSPGIIVDKMAEIGKLLESKNAILQPVKIEISDIRKFCVNTFAEKPHFTLLHTVTACHAFRIVSQYIDNKELAMREIWKAIVVAYLSTGLSYEHATINADNGNVNFKKIITTALESTDPHVIKLVYTCLKEYQAYQDPLYYFIAQRTVSN